MESLSKLYQTILDEPSPLKENTAVGRNRWVALLAAAVSNPTAHLGNVFEANLSVAGKRSDFNRFRRLGSTRGLCCGYKEQVRCQGSFL